MIIQPIKELYGEKGNRVSASKLRISKIKESIGDRNRIDGIFCRLKECLDNGELDRVMNILVNELFYEVISAKFITDIYSTYRIVKDKELFIEKLKESYIIRGIKSARFAWTPLLSN